MYTIWRCGQLSLTFFRFRQEGLRLLVPRGVSVTHATICSNTRNHLLHTWDVREFSGGTELVYAFSNIVSFSMKLYSARLA